MCVYFQTMNGIPICQTPRAKKALPVSLMGAGLQAWRSDDSQQLSTWLMEWRGGK